MAKLYFRYGAMDSAKTMNLLAVAHNYRQQGKTVLLMKPGTDDRFGERVITSRSGLEKEVDLLLEANTVLPRERFEGLDGALVDEAQFLSPFVIDQLRRITVELDVPVICYGLRTDFRTRLFPGSRRLMEVADSIEEVTVTCKFCRRKAVFNLRGDDGAATGGLAVDSNRGWKGPEAYVATVPQVFDLRQDPQERYDLFMNNFTERTWALVSINAAIADLMKTYIKYPPRKLQSEVYTGPITLSNYQRFQYVRDALQKQGFTIGLPTGN